MYGLIGFVIAVFVRDMRLGFVLMVAFCGLSAVAASMMLDIPALRAVPLALLSGAVWFGIGHVVVRALDSLEVWFQRRIVAQTKQSR